MPIVSYPMFQPISGCFIKSRLTPIIYNLKLNELMNRFMLVSTFWAIRIQKVIADGVFNRSWHSTMLLLWEWVYILYMCPGGWRAIHTRSWRVYLFVVIWHGESANGGRLTDIGDRRLANWGKRSKNELSRFCCYKVGYLSHHILQP